MAYWRMQLHPGNSSKAMYYTASSLAAGFIGLDFKNPPGDLTDVEVKDIESTQRDYWDFAHKMAAGDYVLVIVHHFPYALVKVKGEYNYIRHPDNDIGVWFRHFRAIEVIGYYGDRVTNANKWEQLKMTDAISILHTPDKASYQLIQEWLNE
jgi:hypothetical protein